MFLPLGKYSGNIRTPYRFKKILGTLLLDKRDGRPNDEENRNVQSRETLRLKFEVRSFATKLSRE